MKQARIRKTNIVYLVLKVAYKTFNFTEAKSRMVATSGVEIAEWKDAGQKT